MCLVQVLLLAGPGVIVGAALTAVFVKYAFPYHWSWLESLLFGAMLSATDPVAVIALLQEVLQLLFQLRSLTSHVNVALLSDDVDHEIVTFEVFSCLTSGGS